MKVIELLERRRQNWQELERLCDRLQMSGGMVALPPPETARFAALYRAACADLALSDAYQLPQNTVQYLHRLVGRAHNQLYQSRRFDIAAWSRMLLYDVPQQVFGDRCVQAMFLFFWGTFFLSAWLAYDKPTWPEYAETVIGHEQIQALEEMYKDPIDGSDRGGEENTAMAGFYIWHNAGIGLQCFAFGLLVVPGLLISAFNAIFLGAAFGYMARPDVYAQQGQNFFHFVTAHGPFELTAIVLSAGSGLRLGMAWIMPGAWSRTASLMRWGRKMMPVMMSAVIMFMIAALIEGFLSPSGAQYWLKAAVAIVSTVILVLYFGVLGFPRGGRVLAEARA
ncbi:MAG TPA: stage II sporulation protein M [Pirellulaceae bacterium]|nr:stage II sporulation protein M [Pirellulaceae bacterium]